MEYKVKNREWVKNVAIIFLVIMLILTFFSNTIMNASLPEVSTATAQSGTISTMIRGSGTVTASSTYEIFATDTRKIQSVMVKEGQEVSTGDVLFVLAAGDGAELEAAQDALDDVTYTYQVALISAGTDDANGDSREVAQAKTALATAIAKEEANADATDEFVAERKANLMTITSTYTIAYDKLEAAGGSGDGYSGNYAPVSAAKTALTTAQTEQDAIEIQYGAADTLMSKIASWIREDEGSSYTHAAYQKALAAKYELSENGGQCDNLPADIDTLVVLKVDDYSSESEVYVVMQTFVEEDDTDTVVVTYNITYSKTKLAEAYNKVEAAAAAVAIAQTNYDNAYVDYVDSKVPSNSTLAANVAKYKEEMDAAQTEYDIAVERNAAYKEAQAEVYQCQITLENALAADQIADLDMQRLAKQVYDAQALVNELSGESGSGGEIVAEVYGMVTSVNVTAGSMTDTSTALCVIEIPDMGYETSMTVTTEQSRKVTVGDTAEISTGYWGSSLSGRLTSIRSSASDPNSKVLYFAVTGEVESGTNVSIAIGERSQSYSVIVPNSAVREDSNGSFVYVVTAKSSPLGNRYIATRVDVQIQAKDDNNTAITGGVTAYDFVITNSTLPIEAGMQVRMADS